MVPSSHARLSASATSAASASSKTVGVGVGMLVMVFMGWSMRRIVSHVNRKNDRSYVRKVTLAVRE